MFVFIKNVEVAHGIWLDAATSPSLTHSVSHSKSQGALRAFCHLSKPACEQVYKLFGGSVTQGVPGEPSNMFAYSGPRGLKAWQL